MKLSTRQYARRQVKWIRNKLLPAVYAANELHGKQAGLAQRHDITPTFLLDATGTFSFHLRMEVVLIYDCRIGR